MTGRKCCVPFCRANYNKGAGYVPCFTFPSSEERRELWIEAINREDFTPSRTAVVCMKHFEERFIIREDRVTRDVGSLLVVARRKLALRKGAVPTIFQDKPKYFEEYMNTRKKIKRRKEESILLKKWEAATAESDTKLQPDLRICERHFSPQDVEKFYETPMSDGTVYKLRKGRATLKPGAVPCLFPDSPACLTRSIKKEKSPDHELILPDIQEDWIPVKVKQEEDKIMYPSYSRTKYDSVMPKNSREEPRTNLLINPSTSAVFPDHPSESNLIVPTTVSSSDSDNVPSDSFSSTSLTPAQQNLPSTPLLPVTKVEDVEPPEKRQKTDTVLSSAGPSNLFEAPAYIKEEMVSSDDESGIQI